MKNKVYSFSMDNFIRGRVVAKSKHKVRKHLKSRYGAPLYNQLKKKTKIWREDLSPAWIEGAD